MKNMRDVPPEERPSMGKLLNALRQWTEEKFDKLAANLKSIELKRKYAEEKIDVTMPGQSKVPKSKTIITILLP